MGLFWAALLGLVASVALPMVFGGPTGFWMEQSTAWWTIAPLPGSPGLLVSIPVFVAVTLFSWFFFNWSNR